MITGIREKTVVNKNGMIEISAPDLPIGAQVEVIVLIENEELEATEYLLSTEANRKYLDEALEELKHPEKFVSVEIDKL